MPPWGASIGAASGADRPEGGSERERGPSLFLSMFLLLQFFLLVYILVIVKLSGAEALAALLVSLLGLAVGLYFLAKQITQRF